MVGDGRVQEPGGRGRRTDGRSPDRRWRGWRGTPGTAGAGRPSCGRGRRGRSRRRAGGGGSCTARGPAGRRRRRTPTAPAGPRRRRRGLRPGAPARTPLMSVRASWVYRMVRTSDAGHGPPGPADAAARAASVASIRNRPTAQRGGPTSYGCFGTPPARIRAGEATRTAAAPDSCLASRWAEEDGGGGGCRRRRGFALDITLTPAPPYVTGKGAGAGSAGNRVGNQGDHADRWPGRGAGCTCGGNVLLCLARLTAHNWDASHPRGGQTDRAIARRPAGSSPDAAGG